MAPPCPSRCLLTGLAAVSTALLLVASAQTEEPDPAADLGVRAHAAPPVENILDQTREVSANVGKGHYTASTDGGMRLSLGAGGLGGFSFHANAGGAYFLTDNILVGAGIGFGLNVSGSTVFGALPLHLSADFYASLNPALFWFAGMRVSPQINFGSLTRDFLGIHLGLRGGVSIFLTNWFAIEPHAFLDIDPRGQRFDLGLRWGVRWFF